MENLNPLVRLGVPDISSDHGGVSVWAVVGSSVSEAGEDNVVVEINVNFSEL